MIWDVIYKIKRLHKELWCKHDYYKPPLLTYADYKCTKCGRTRKDLL